jgi:hypothetical protein
MPYKNIGMQDVSHFFMDMLGTISKWYNYWECMTWLNIYGHLGVLHTATVGLKDFEQTPLERT